MPPNAKAHQASFPGSRKLTGASVAVGPSKAVLSSLWKLWRQHKQADSRHQATTAKLQAELQELGKGFQSLASIAETTITKQNALIQQQEERMKEVVERLNQLERALSTPTLLSMPSQVVQPSIPTDADLNYDPFGLMPLDAPDAATTQPPPGPDQGDPVTHLAGEAPSRSRSRPPSEASNWDWMQTDPAEGQAAESDSASVSAVSQGLEAEKPAHRRQNSDPHLVSTIGRSLPRNPHAPGPSPFASEVQPLPAGDDLSKSNSLPDVPTLVPSVSIESIHSRQRPTPQPSGRVPEELPARSYSGTCANLARLQKGITRQGLRLNELCSREAASAEAGAVSQPAVREAIGKGFEKLEIANECLRDAQRADEALTIFLAAASHGAEKTDAQISSEMWVTKSRHACETAYSRLFAAVDTVEQKMHVARVAATSSQRSLAGSLLGSMRQLTGDVRRKTERGGGNQPPQPQTTSNVSGSARSQTLPAHTKIGSLLGRPPLVSKILDRVSMGSTDSAPPTLPTEQPRAGGGHRRTMSDVTDGTAGGIGGGRGPGQRRSRQDSEKIEEYGIAEYTGTGMDDATLAEYEELNRRLQLLK